MSSKNDNTEIKVELGSMPPEGYLSASRRSEIAASIKDKAQKVEDRIIRNRDNELKKQFKALSKKPSADALSLGKSFKETDDKMQKLKEDNSEKLEKLDEAYDKEVETIEKANEKKRKAIMESLDKLNKEEKEDLAKSREKYDEKCSDEMEKFEKAIEPLEEKVLDIKEEASELGYVVDLSVRKKFVRPMHKDKEANVLGGPLAESIRETARVQLEKVTDSKKAVDILVNTAGTALESSVRSLAAEISDISTDITQKS